MLGDDAHRLSLSDFCCSTGQQNWRGCGSRDRLDDRHAYVSRRARWVVPFNTAPPHSTRFNEPQNEHGKSRTCVCVARGDGHANRCHNLADHWRGGDGSQAYSSRVTVLEFNIVVGIYRRRPGRLAFATGRLCSRRRYRRAPVAASIVSPLLRANSRACGLTFS